MSAATLIEKLTKRDVRLMVRGDKLKIDAPAGTLTEADRELLRQHKAELLALLATDPRIAAEPCPTCCGATLTESGEGWQHRWCPEAGHFDSWSAGGLGAFRNHSARRKLEADLARHECPECHAQMTLQCREPETWYCPGCRLWAIEGRLQ
jgi:hypothetical protein